MARPSIVSKFISSSGASFFARSAAAFLTASSSDPLRKWMGTVLVLVADAAMQLLYAKSMEHLWAPWRNLYVKDNRKTEGDIFAEIARSSDDETNYVLARGKSCFALLNVFPYNTGHLMVVPYRVTGDLEDLSDDETLE